LTGVGVGAAPAPESGITGGQEMIVTLTHADIRSIVNFYADQGVKLAPALRARMSDEQLDMAAEIYGQAGQMFIDKADKLAEKLAAERERRRKEAQQ
jgi:pantothenate kinase-related protein Tda10